MVKETRAILEKSGGIIINGKRCKNISEFTSEFEDQSYKTTHEFRHQALKVCLKELAKRDNPPVGVDCQGSSSSVRLPRIQALCPVKNSEASRTGRNDLATLALFDGQAYFDCVEYDPCRHFDFNGDYIYHDCKAQSVNNRYTKIYGRVLSSINKLPLSTTAKKILSAIIQILKIESLVLITNNLHHIIGLVNRVFK